MTNITKRAASLAAVVLIALCGFACSGGSGDKGSSSAESSDSNLQGTYVIYSMSSGDLKYDYEAITSYDLQNTVTMTIYEDNKGELKVFDETLEVKIDPASGVISTEQNGNEETTECKIDGDTISFDLDDKKVVMAKSNSKLLEKYSSSAKSTSQ